jgi:hypothetical protein
MRTWKLALLALSLSVPYFLCGGSVQAQTIQFTVHELALKSGESSEVADVYYVSTNCKSLLKATPAVEILDGPPGVSATINPADVVPRGLGCAKPVKGGKLVISAKDVQDHSYTRMVLRINMQTASGDRQVSRNFNVNLFPPN